MEKLNFSLSSDKILSAVLNIFKKKFKSVDSGNFLDIGSGNGTLVSLIKEYAPNFTPNCVDYTDTLLLDKTIKLDVVDLNFNKLPHQDNSFEFVSCTEVIEHLENYRLIIRESYRVLKNSGIAVFTTPNVLNLNSRLRYLQYGFHSLFGPLTVNREEAFSTGGHITPIQYFYLAHALKEAGFKNIKLSFDKKQTSAMPWLIIFYPIIYVMSYLTGKRETRKQTINATNIAIVDEINTLDMLLGRTIIVSAEK